MQIINKPLIKLDSTRAKVGDRFYKKIGDNNVLVTIEENNEKETKILLQNGTRLRIKKRSK